MGRVTARDVLSILEAVYRNASSDEAWLAEVVEAARPHLDVGAGIAGFLYDVSDGARIHTIVAHGADSFVDIARAVGEALGPEAASELFAGPPGFGPLSQLPVTSAVLRRDPAFGTFAALGYADLACLRASTRSRQGALLVAPSRSPIALSSEDAFAWRRVADHVAAALRLRRREQDARKALAAAVVRDARSDVAPAPAPERAPLLSDVVPSGTARAQLEATYERAAEEPAAEERDEDVPASSPVPVVETAAAAWEGLLAGRWTLLDQFEHDGQVFLVARRTDAAPAAAQAELSAREIQIARLAALGHSNKLIAYEMGLSISTVALHLSRASRKLGATSRVALIRAVKQLDVGAPRPEASSGAPLARAEGGPRGDG